MKHLFLILVPILFIGGCAADHEMAEHHATKENVEHCLEDHSDDPYEEALAHCQKEICGTDAHCFEEVAGLSK